MESTSHVEWRSIAEMINYLGALLRARSAESAQWSDVDASGASESHTLFRLSAGSKVGFSQVAYGGTSYTIPSDTERDPNAPQDHTFRPWHF